MSKADIRWNYTDRVFRHSRRALLTALALSPLYALGSSSHAGKRPKTIALDWALAETMLAIGHPPLAVVAASDWARYVVEPILPNSVRDLGLQQEINLELLARLQPDLILTSPFVGQLDDVLPRIATTHRLSIFEPTDSPLEHPRKLTLQLGELLAMRSEADTFITSADEMLEHYRARLSKLTLPRMIIGSFTDERHVRVYGGAGLFQNVLDKIGVVNAWQKPTGYWGFATIGVEELADTDAGHFVSAGPLPAGIHRRLNTSPLWSRLSFVESGSISVLAPVFMFGALPAALRFARLLTDEMELFYQ